MNTRRYLWSSSQSDTAWRRRTGASWSPRISADAGRFVHIHREELPVSETDGLSESPVRTHPSIRTRMNSPFLFLPVSPPSRLPVQAQGVEVPFSCFLSLCCEDGKGRSLNNRMSLIAAPEGRLPLWVERDIPQQPSWENQSNLLIGHVSVCWFWSWPLGCITVYTSMADIRTCWRTSAACQPWKPYFRIQMNGMCCAWVSTLTL